MNAKHKEEVREALAGKSVKFYQIQQEKNSYRFVRRELRELELKRILEHIFNCADGSSFTFEIVRNKLHGYAAIAEFDIVVSDKLSRNQILEFTEDLKQKRARTSKTIFYNFFLKGKAILGSPSAICRYQNDKYFIDNTNF